MSDAAFLNVLDRRSSFEAVIRRMIGENVRRYRLAAELSQTELANRMGFSTMFISQFENGIALSSLAHIYRFAAALGLKVNVLLDLPIQRTSPSTFLANKSDMTKNQDRPGSDQEREDVTFRQAEATPTLSYAEDPDDEDRVAKWWAAGLQIDPATAEIESSNFMQVSDPDGIDVDVPMTYFNVWEVYFARSPGSPAWVCFCYLPEATRDALWERLKKLPEDHRLFPLTSI